MYPMHALAIYQRAELRKSQDICHINRRIIYEGLKLFFYPFDFGDRMDKL